MKFFVQVQCLVPLALVELCHRDPRPARDDPGDLIVRDTLVHQRHLPGIDRLLLQFQLSSEFRELPIAQLCRFLQISFPLRDLDLVIHVFDVLTQPGQLLHACLLVIPLCLAVVKLRLLLGQFCLQRRQPLRTQPVLLLLQCRDLDLHLHDPPLQLVKLGGQGIQLCLDHGTCLIHQIDRLVGQETVCDIAV